jgi:hypothetical protein
MVYANPLILSLSKKSFIVVLQDYNLKLDFKISQEQKNFIFFLLNEVFTVSLNSTIEKEWIVKWRLGFYCLFASHESNNQQLLRWHIPSMYYLLVTIRPDLSFFHLISYASLFNIVGDQWHHGINGNMNSTVF